MNKKQKQKLAELLELHNKLTTQLVSQMQQPQAQVVSYPEEVIQEVPVTRIIKKDKDQFNHWFYFASLVMLFIKLTDITQIGWQGVFAPLLFLGLFKFFGKA